MKNRFTRLLCACIALAASSLTPLSGSARPPEVPASLVAAAVAFDLQSFIDARVAAGDTTIVIPPGRHLVTPRDKQHLSLRGLRNIVIEATGAELVCTETTRAITIENCENLTLRGLVIDYDPLPFTQARITAISEDQTRLELQTIPGYGDIHPEPVKMETFASSTNELRNRLTFYGISAEVHGPGRATLVRPASISLLSADQVGDIAVLYNEHTPGGFLPHAIMATASRGLSFENVTLYAGPTFGFFENGCDGSRYINCRVDRRPSHLDYATRGYPRLRSMNADAYHSKNARLGPLYDRCLARYNGDDSIALNGDYHFITRAAGKTLRVLAKYDMTMRAGDIVQIFTFDGRRLKDKKIVALVRDGSATTEERAFSATKSIFPNHRENGLADAWLVTLDASAEDTPPGSLIASSDSIGSGFIIRNCTLGHNRSRGILVKAGRGEITGNTLSGSIQSSILVSPEYYWLEAGLADDLVIANNTLRDIRGPGIVITALGGDASLAPAGAFRNITIRDNTISGGPAPGLLITSVAGLVNKNNRVSADVTRKLNPWEIKTWSDQGVKEVMLLNNQ